MTSGARHLGQAPVLPHSLLNWEFLAVTEGRCGIILDSGEKLSLREQCLWIFSPGFVHGWHGDKGSCGVVSFQVESVPIQLAAAIRASGFLEYGLSPAEFEEIAGLKKVIHPEFQNRNPLNELRFDRAILQMSLMALGGMTVDSARVADLRITRTVNKAMEWFRCHLTERPSVPEMAAAAGVSSSYLRRFFKSEMNQQPRQVMMDIRMEVAVQLIETTSLIQDTIAARAGFAGVRAFTRAFNARHRCSPGNWRHKARASKSAPRLEETPAAVSSGEYDDDAIIGKCAG